MKKFLLFSFGLLFLVFNSYSQSQMDGFILPADVMENGWQYYYSRSFYYDQNHLGADINLGEGVPIKAIATGKIVFYGPASSYGELLVAIEHTLPETINFLDANGSIKTTNSILSIYGHLRASQIRGGTQLTWSYGQIVQQGSIIGYINDDAHNGDGAEHLHLGIRLSNEVTAKSVDGSKWLRGYKINADGTNSGMQIYFTDPIPWILGLAQYQSSPSWHSYSNNQPSISFVDAHNRYPNNIIAYNVNKFIGNPNDKGGGRYVHYWSFTNNPINSNGVWVQDYKNTNVNTRFGIDGETAVILNEQNKQAYVVKEGFWGWYKRHDGYYNLGSPLTEEYQVNSSGHMRQDFTFGKLLWAQPSTGGDWEIIPLYNNMSYMNESRINLVFNEGGDRPLQIIPKTVRNEVITKEGERIITYYRNGVQIPAPQPQSSISGQGGYIPDSPLSGVEIWHGSEYLGNTPLEINGYESFIYELTAKVNGVDVPFSFEAHDGMIVEVPSSNPSGGGLAVVNTFTITPPNPNPGGDNVTLSATLGNTSGNSAFYNYIELVVLDANFQSTGLREVAFDVTIQNSSTYSISRTFSINTSGEYYAAVRYSIDNLNWSYFAPGSGNNPVWFRVGSAPAPTGELKVSSFVAQNADNLEPNEPHSLEITLNETLGEPVLYDVSVDLLDAQMQMVTYQLSYWDSITVNANGSWVGFAPSISIANTGQYYYRVRGFNYSTSQWSVLNTTGSGVNPLGVSVTEDSVVQIHHWAYIPDTLKVDTTFTGWCNLEIPVGNAVVYDTVAFWILDSQMQKVGEANQRFTNVTFNPNVGVNFPVVMTTPSIPDLYYVEAVGYMSGGWSQFQPIWNLANPKPLFVYSEVISGTVVLDQFSVLQTPIIWCDSLRVVVQLKETNGYPLYLDSIKVALKSNTGTFIRYCEYKWTNVFIEANETFDLGTFRELIYDPMGTLMSKTYQLEIFYSSGSGSLVHMGTSSGINNPITFEVVVPSAIQSKIIASDPYPSDQFGWSVDIDGDYCVVGSAKDDDKGADAGSAYVYHLVNNVWTQIAKITASDGAAGDWFGSAVAIDGNYILVGSQFDDDRGTSTGAAYLYYINKTTQEVFQTNKICPSYLSGGMLFGAAVDISGDKIVIGTPYFYNGGAAYLFYREDESVRSYQRINEYNGTNGDMYGYSVAINGDYVVVGANSDANTVSRGGAAYVYYYNLNDLYVTELGKIVPNDVAIDDFFGYDVAVEYPYVVSSSRGDDDKGSNSGSFYVYKSDSSGFSQFAKLTAFDGAANDQFGHRVDICSEYIVSSAYFDVAGYYRSGSAYLFRVVDDTVFYMRKIIPSDGRNNDNFGYSLAIDQGRIIAGSYYDDHSNFVDPGSAYIYTGFTSVPLAKQSIFEQELGEFQIPEQYTLESNYPNPFNPSTTIKYSLPTTEQVSLKVYNILGQEVITLVDELQDAGYKQIVWNGRDSYGSQVASGVYIYRLQTDKFVQSKKMILLK